MSAVEHIKEVADLVKKFNDIELNRRILNLEDEVLDLARAKRRGEEKIEDLERTLKFKGELKFKEPFYWIDGDSVPFCPNCWEKDHIPIHVIHLYTTEEGMTKRDCPTCKTGYRTESSQPGHRSY
jgi:hypothetical protein